MKLSIGIVGLPNVGKSTLFKILTKQEVNIANYPFATINPNVGVVPVPDERLAVLARLSRSQKIIPAVVEFYDIAGLVKDAHKGEGLGNQFLSHIREVNALVHVVRCFPANDIIHVEQNVDPLRDIDTIHTELIFKDLEAAEKRLKKAEDEAKSGDGGKVKELETVKSLWSGLNQGRLARELNLELPPDLALLTDKPQIFLLNGGNEDVNDELKNKIKGLDADFIIADLSLRETMPELIRQSYRILNLISFFTTGEMETRAWTVKQGTKMPQAAGAIHTDFEKKFIRAEVVHCDKFVEAGGWNDAKARGWLRLEGREYAVKDGDIVLIRHSA